MKPQSVSLFYKEGSSDKVYNASLETQGKGWVVKFSYGRRGSALTTGNKTLKPIPFHEALQVYESLVRSKTQKGYTPEKSGVPFISTVNEQRSVGWIPQLLNEIEEAELENYLKNPEFCMQEKFDGRNRLLLMEKTGPIGANRKGLEVALTEEVKTEMSIMSKGDVIAGEDMGDTIHCFDIISQGKLPYRQRLSILNALMSDPHLKHLKFVETAVTEKEKRALYKELVKNNAEGVVFKHLDASYTPGRPASGGAQVKFKFVATCSVIAGDINKGKRSVEMWIYDEIGKCIQVGNVTVYPNQDLPKKEDILEVKYLYAYKGGSLFQPVLLGVREDLDLKDCTIDQLKFKKEEETVS